MDMDFSLAPLAPDRFTPAAARHLLWRLGYGGDWAQVQALTEVGLDAAVKQLLEGPGPSSTAALPEPELELDPDVKKPLNAEQRKRLNQARRSEDQEVLRENQLRNQAARREDNKMFYRLKTWWLERMLLTPHPAEERLTLLWHGHFASSQRQVNDTYLMYRQHQLFRKESRGSFADLARGIVHDPAMLLYLNNNRNHKRNPNENLAREIMELFTLGEGNYSEDDIKAGARALTGYHTDDNDFIFRKGGHDHGPKTILGKTDAFDGDSLVEHLLRQDACATLVALKLYDYFVADVGDVYPAVPRENQRVIRALARHLQRAEYQLTPVLTTLFKSRHFYDPAIMGRKIKDPLQLLVGTARALHTPPPPTRSPTAMQGSMAAMGMELFAPPTVDGWDGGRAWINTSTLFVRQNLATYLISGRHPEKKFNRKNIGYDPTQLREAYVLPEDPSPIAATDRVIDTLVGPHLTAERRAPIHRFVADRGPDKGLSKDGLVALFCLITAMPEYQLC